MESVTDGKMEMFITSGWCDSGLIRCAAIIFGGYRRQTICGCPCSTKVVEWAQLPQLISIFEAFLFEIIELIYTINYVTKKNDSCR